MKKRNINFITAFLFIIGMGGVSFLLGHTEVNPEQIADNEAIYGVHSIDVPQTIEFAGQRTDLTRYDCRERMDRELMAFTYMHSSTMLIIKRANRYFPVVEPILKENGVPDDFKYLMAIESNLNMEARSPTGAAGLWQFMPATGKEFGLEINSNVDERYDIVKATRAACKYFQAAYAKYGDWLLVAAAYNGGTVRISNELQRQQADKAVDLRLSEETSRYLFRIMAMKQVFSNPRSFGFLIKKEHLYPPFSYEKVEVSEGIADLSVFAKQRNITYAQLKDANPWLRDYYLENKKQQTYILNIPLRKSINYDPKMTVVYDEKWVIDR
ncbi:Membrane-bound lytic murein transglycosylase D [termite gut metagenome]|uniref:Membrane-bound lytic murein transglycosylase D n=1 Tax=termite gut metagenome TaxID=433724 RepID=A0A5J4SA20_9ZZZZ